jgi:hypothetical protein
MNTPINNGGPAFPLQDWDLSIHARRFETGMTLRDYFAAHETLGDWNIQEVNMPSDWADLLAGYKRPVNDPIGWLRWEADWQSALKYIRADAMLRAREKGTQ